VNLKQGTQYFINMEFLIYIFLFYFKIGIIFAIGAFLWMFSFNKEKEFKTQEYFFIIIIYPFIIYNLIKIFKNNG